MELQRTNKQEKSMNPSTTVSNSSPTIAPPEITLVPNNSLLTATPEGRQLAVKMARLIVIIKNGTTRRGKQNYQCRDCGRQFVEHPQWKPKDKDTYSLIDRLLLERIPLAGIARVLQLSFSISFT
jgi:hypothetical protein